ncbi:MAG: hypothetical protein AAGA77_02880 [Bacteroidota bacterium]
MKKYSKNTLKKNEINKAKGEFKELIDAKSTSDSLKLIKKAGEDLKEDKLKSFELTNQGIDNVLDSIKEENIPDLIEMLEQIEYPMFGGEERAIYFNMVNKIADKICSLTDIEGIGKGAFNPEDLNKLLNSAKDWCEKHGS